MSVFSYLMGENGFNGLSFWWKISHYTHFLSGRQGKKKMGGRQRKSAVQEAPTQKPALGAPVFVFLQRRREKEEE
ncbi:MAG: hypothetical protein ACOY4H_07035 [Thermodesulfobacteriota bacterium]